MIISTAKRCINMAKAKKVKEVEKEVSVKSDEEKLAESLDTISLNEELSLEKFKEKVEESRSDMYKTYSSQRKVSNILIPVVGLLMAGSFILFLGIQEMWGKILGGVIIGVTLVGMVVYYILTKNKLPNKSNSYIRNFAISSDSYVFSHADYSNQTLYFKKRFAIAEFAPDRVYKDLVDIASRNIVSFDYKEHNVTVGEVALYKQGAKRNQKQILFVGKYMSFTNDFHFEDRYIINIRGKNDVDLANDIDDLVILNEHNKFSIYGIDGSKFEKDLGKELINDLKSIDCTGSLLNVNIAIWAGHTAVYMSYDDSVVAIPLDKELNAAAYQKLKKDIHDLLSILVK